MTKTELMLNAYIPSAGEYDKYFSKFRAFMNAELSEKAKKNGAWDNNAYKKGYFFLRTPLGGSSSRMLYGDYDGVRNWYDSGNNNAGLRVAFQLIYNPKCNLVKGCEMRARESLVWNNKKGSEYSGIGKDELVKSTAPIVKFGGKECIWLNKEECESGKDKTMQLWTLDLIDRAVPFDRNCQHSDFGKAYELRKQCEEALTEGCTAEELEMLVTVKMSSEDNYEKVEPILKEEKEKETTVESLFEDLYQGKIDEEDLRKGLKEISKAAREKDGATEKDAKVLSEKIAEEAKRLNERLAADEKGQAQRLAEMEKLNAAFDEVDTEIDELTFGGKQ